MTDTGQLNAALLNAHAAGDTAALVALYHRAADIVQGNEAAFFLTQAYVHALEIDDPRAAQLRHALVSLGREAP
ncbi:MAG: hypothetical protein ACRBBU_07630 [Pseudooceanicola sp.]